jgi:hypothetical protein
MRQSLWIIASVFAARMKITPLLIAAVMFCGYTPRLKADQTPPPCVATSLSSYESLGATGCTIGSTVFSNFTGGTPSASSIGVSPFSGIFTTTSN